MVVVGDSLSAGVQNFSLLDEQQPNGYASIIARQAGLPLSLPLVPFPGSPNVLHLTATGIEPVEGTLPFPPRDNPNVEPTNLAIPGLTVSSALTLRPTSGKPSSPEQEWATIVLGFPNLPFWAPTEIELATALRPQLVIEWLGNNDALVPALAGQLDALTPANQFALNYEQILDRLAGTRAKLVTATIPDVTETAFFTSAQQIANQAAGGNIDFVTQTLGIGPNDYVRPSAQPFIASILTDPTKGPLPSACPAPLPDLGVATLPCVLTEADAKKVRARVNCYNTIIKVETALHGGVVVDINRLVNQIYINGYNVAGKTLTANFLGGLFSLDGIHPTNTGYGIIANEFIRTMNAQMNMKIPPADLAAILASDPLRDDILPGPAVGQAPPPAGNSCFAN
ncbi:MAG TPA: SGNH/GDSL hydrolase family protein [Bryobacteraceae bacterium]